MAAIGALSEVFDGLNNKAAEDYQESSCAPFSPLGEFHQGRAEGI